MNQSYPMNSVVAHLVEVKYDIVSDYVENHPAHDEGFAAFYRPFYDRQRPVALNPHEEGTDGFYEWKDGYDTAEMFSLVYNNYVRGKGYIFEH